MFGRARSCVARQARTRGARRWSMRAKWQSCSAGTERRGARAGKVEGGTEGREAENRKMTPDWVKAESCHSEGGFRLRGGREDRLSWVGVCRSEIDWGGRVSWGLEA
jgi:hypothetical protein